MTIRYADLTEVIEWRRNARSGDLVTFASGERLDGKHPVLALVHGWERLGLVEVVSDSVLGHLRHRFKRTRADFPAGWFDPVPMLPERPPALRDPSKVGVAAMAHFAIAGDEEAAWVRQAALEVEDRLGRNLAALSRYAQHPDRAKLLENLEGLAFEARSILWSVAELLNPQGNSARFAKIKWRRSGRQATGQRWNAVLAEHAAAASVEAAVAAGDVKTAALNAASKGDKNSKGTGISEGRIKVRLAQRARLMSWEDDKAIAEAAQLVQAMTRGGLTQAAALAEIAAATGQSKSEIRKALREHKKSK